MPIRSTTLKDETGAPIKEDNVGVMDYFSSTNISNCYSAGVLNSENEGVVYEITNPLMLQNDKWTHYRLRGDLSDYFYNNYYLGDDGAVDEYGTAKTAEEFKAAAMPGMLGSAYTTLSGINDGYPALKWQGETSGDLTTVEPPLFTLTGGGFSNDVMVEMATATEGATIFYTTDGSTPGIRNGEEYTEPIPLTGTVKAIAYKDGMYLSVVNMVSVETVADPVITPSSGQDTDTLLDKTKVSITTTTKGATIYYTTDGSDPVIYGESRNILGLTAKKYTGKITVEDPLTIKAVAVAEGMHISGTTSHGYEFTWDNRAEEPRQDSEGTYLISSQQELVWFARLVDGTLSGVPQKENANAKLTRDIDMGLYVWSPVGDVNKTTFAGTFDGDGHTIKNLNFGHGNYDFMTTGVSPVVRMIQKVCSTVKCRYDQKSDLYREGCGYCHRQHWHGCRIQQWYCIPNCHNEVLPSIPMAALLAVLWATTAVPWNFAPMWPPLPL